MIGTLRPIQRQRDSGSRSIYFTLYHLLGTGWDVPTTHLSIRSTQNIRFSLAYLRYGSVCVSMYVLQIDADRVLVLPETPDFIKYFTDSQVGSPSGDCTVREELRLDVFCQTQGTLAGVVIKRSTKPRFQWVENI